jgi:hypothetical protein
MSARIRGCIVRTCVESSATGDNSVAASMTIADRGSAGERAQQYQFKRAVRHCLS